MTQRSFIAWFVALGLVCTAGPVLASCGQAFCPIETSTTTERHPSGGELQLNLVYEFIDVDDPYIGADSARVGEIPRRHDEQFTRNQTLKFFLDYGLTPRLSLGLLLPLVDRLHQHRANGEDGDEDHDGDDHRDDELFLAHHEHHEPTTERWRYTDLGDIQVTARYLLVQPETPLQPAFSLLIGMKLPTGRTSVENDQGEKAELTLQPGNGSWDGIIGLSYVQHFSTWTLLREASLLSIFATVRGQFPIGEGKFGYRPGGEMVMSAGLAYPLIRKLDLLAQVNFHYRDRDDVGHAPGVEEQDSGRETIFLSPGLRYHLTDELAVYALMQFAVYRRVNGIQLTSDWNVASGISYRFNLLSGA